MTVRHLTLAALLVAGGPLAAEPQSSSAVFCAGPSGPPLPEELVPPTDPALLVGHYLCEDEGIRFSLTLEAGGRYVLKIAPLHSDGEHPVDVMALTEQVHGRWLLEEGRVFVATTGSSSAKEERDTFYPADPAGMTIVIPAGWGAAVLHRQPAAR